jgi:GDP-mannose 6-dehydrogenase
MRVAVFGLGYVGTVTAAGLSSRGHRVVGVDVDELKVEAIRHGRSPVVEPGIDDAIASGVAAGTLTATTDARVALDKADLSLICVGTPSAPNGDTDLTYVSRALADLRDAMAEAEPPATGFHSVVMRSTVPPGTGADVVAPVFAEELLPDGWSVGTAMCPEFLREGCGVEDFFAPPFVVVGTDDERTRAALSELFAFLGQDIHQVEVGTAEALKYACNAFHATKVSFANEMARVFRSRGVDTREVMQIFCEDHKLNISPYYLRPGFAFGGSCLPKDLRALLYKAKTVDVSLPILAAILPSNERQIERGVQAVIEQGSKRVSVLGLSFKAGTDDLRESPVVELTERLIGKGYDLRIYDSNVRLASIHGANRDYILNRIPHISRLMTESLDEALDHADTVVIGNAAPEFGDVPKRLSDRQTLIDFVRVTDSRSVSGIYEGICW